MLTHTSWQPPAQSDLHIGLNAALAKHASDIGAITVLDRHVSRQSSSFPAEIVTCRLGNGRQIRLLCKYGSGHTASGFGHRWGVPYEIEIYRDVLSTIGVPVVPYYGSYLDEAADEHWLFIEFLDGMSRVHETIDPAAALEKAACWLGQFHSAGEHLLRDGTMARLNAYDHDYLAGWSRRTLDFAEPWLPQFPWLPNLCNRFAEVIPILLADRVNIIHGEFYPKNILVRGEDVRPVDWESAAMARGEIDLASLTDGWSPDVVSRCEQAYIRSRFPRSVPADFSHTLLAARLYLHFRWLGNKKDETVRPERRRRFEYLYDDGLRLGLI